MSLCPSQHAYLPSRGTDTANIQLLNTLEDSWSRRSSLYGSSWDMSKAFDSVSRPLIILCWQRLGVPVELAQWLVALDLGGHAIIRSDFALDLLDQQGKWRHSYRIPSLLRGAPVKVISTVPSRG